MPKRRIKRRNPKLRVSGHEEPKRGYHPILGHYIETRDGSGNRVMHFGSDTQPNAGRGKPKGCRNV